MDIKGRSKDKFKEVINKEVTNLFQTVLDYAQVACPDDKAFKVLRSRILRAGNDCIRTLSTSLNSYDVIYNADKVDVVEVIRK